MAFASFDRKSSSAPVSDINMVPLIDVMLVLLVIFIVTAPLLTHAVKLDLPKASSAVNQAPPQKIEFAIDATGQLFWNGEPVSREDAAALYLPGQDTNGKLDSILVNATAFGADNLYDLTVGEAAYRIQLNRIIRKGADWIRARFEIKGKV